MNLSPIRYCPLWDTHYDTPFLRPSAYKVRVEGVSPQYEIKQICASGSKGPPCPSQSEQYLIGEKFVPPTLSIINYPLDSQHLSQNNSES